MFYLFLEKAKNLLEKAIFGKFGRIHSSAYLLEKLPELEASCVAPHFDQLFQTQSLILALDFACSDCPI